MCRLPKNVLLKFKISSANSRMDDQSQSCYRVRITNKYLVISTLGIIRAATTSWNRTPKGRTPCPTAVVVFAFAPWGQSLSPI
jgi:hypothetical protein